MEFFALLVGAGVLGLIPMVIASSKGRTSLFGWWLYGILLWPIAMLHALVMERIDEPDRPTSEQSLIDEYGPTVGRKLERVEKAHRDGILTKAAYEAAKEEILGRLE